MFDIFKELWHFFRMRKKWWLLPIVVILILVAVFVVVGYSPVIAPFIYTLF